MSSGKRTDRKRSKNRSAVTSPELSSYAVKVSRLFYAACKLAVARSRGMEHAVIRRGTSEPGRMALEAGRIIFRRLRARHHAGASVQEAQPYRSDEATHD